MLVYFCLQYDVISGANAETKELLELSINAAAAGSAFEHTDSYFLDSYCFTSK